LWWWRLWLRCCLALPPPPLAGAQDIPPGERGKQIGTATWNFDYDDPDDAPPADYQALVDNFDYHGATSGVTILETEELTRTARYDDGTNYEEVYAARITVWCHAAWVCTWNGGDVSVEGNFTVELAASPVPEEVPYEAPDEDKIDAASLTRGTVRRNPATNPQYYTYPAPAHCGQLRSNDGQPDTEGTSQSSALEWELLSYYYRPDVTWVNVRWERGDEPLVSSCLLNASETYDGVEFTNLYIPLVRADVPVGNFGRTRSEWRLHKVRMGSPFNVFQLFNKELSAYDSGDVYSPRGARYGHMDKPITPVADVLPRVKTPIYYCPQGELRGKTCYEKLEGVNEYSSYSSVDEDVVNSERSLPSLTAPRESDAPVYVPPTQQQIERCGFDDGCLDALFVSSSNAFNRAAERYDAQLARFWQEVEKRARAGESFWMCIPRDDWLKRLSDESMIFPGSRCYLID